MLENSAKRQNSKIGYGQTLLLAVLLPGSFRLCPELDLAINPARRSPDDTDLDRFGQQRLVRWE